MKRCMILEVSDWKVSMPFFASMKRKLQEREGILLWGDVKPMQPLNKDGSGYYVVSVEYAQGLNVGTLMLGITGLFCLSLGWTLLGQTLLGATTLLLLLFAFLISKRLSIALMRFRLRRLTGKKIMVADSTNEWLWRFAHGEV